MSITSSPRAPTDLDRRVGLRIAALRKAKGLSQTALGDAIGVTFQQVQKYELGYSRLTAARLKLIADLLAVPVGTLFDEERPPATEQVFDLLAVDGAGDLLQLYARLDRPVRREALAILRCLARAVVGESDEVSAPPSDPPPPPVRPRR